MGWREAIHCWELTQDEKANGKRQDRPFLCQQKAFDTRELLRFGLLLRIVMLGSIQKF